MSEDDFRYLAEEAIMFHEKQGIETLDDYYDILSFLINNPPKDLLWQPQN